MFYWENKVFELIGKNDQIYKKIKMYVELVLKYNNEFNLTGFDEEKIWLEGIYQSIFLLNKFINEKNVDLLDIGAGAGFPSIPFYIYKNEQINLTIYEPIQKRVNFLNLVKNELNLKNLTIIRQRAEESEEEEKYNFITARAVMSLPKLIEVSSKVGKIGCNYIFLKSKEAELELINSKWIIEKLGLNNVKILNIDLNDNKTHNIVFFKKTNKTPQKFPRSWIQINKSN